MRRERTYRHYRKTRTNIINISTSLILMVSSLGGALPLFLSQKVFADSTINISTAAELRSAIENQADGQTWTIEPGTYALTPTTDITAGPGSLQTGWYFPITANNITINGVGNPTVYGNNYTANGVWATQDLMAIFGNNVTINGLKLMPKIEPNKTIEVLGNDTTIENTTIEPNTLTNPSEIGSLSDPTEADWGGSIYYNNAGGTQMLDNVTVENGGISDHSPSASLNLTNVALNYSTAVDWINGYRFATHGNPVTGTPNITYHVSSTLDNLNSVLSNIQNGDTVDLDSSLTTTQQITLTKSITVNGNGHTISPDFAKSSNDNNSALGIQASNVTVNDLVEDGTNGTNLHGINVFDATGVNLNNVTVENNNRTGLNVDGSAVTANNLTTANDGWDGADVDKAGAVLTVDGTSHQTETSPDIYVDDTTVGQVIDTNSQYSYINNVKDAGDRAYYLKATAPNNTRFLTDTNATLTCGTTVNTLYNNKLQFVWDSTSSNSTGYRTLITYPDGSTKWAYTNTRNLWIGKTIYNDNGFGEHGNGTYSYQVEARNAANTWSPPAAPCDLYYDTRIPVATFVAQPPKFVNGNFQVTITATDNVALKNVFVDVRTKDNPNNGSNWVAGCTNGQILSGNLTARSQDGSGVSVTYTCTVNTSHLVDGTTYTLRANASDYAGYGNVNTSKYWQFTVDRTLPILSNFKINPSNSAAYKKHLNVSAEATDINGVANVEYYITAPRASDGVCDGTGTKLADTVVTAPYGGKYKARLNITSLNGTYCVNAVAEDVASNRSLPVQSIKFVADNINPTVGITTPADGHVYNGIVDVQAQLDDNGSGLKKYRVVIQHKNVHNRWVNVPGSWNWANVSSTPFSGTVYNWDTKDGRFPDGQYRVLVYDKDMAGNQQHAHVDVNVDNTAPTGLANLSPANSTYSTTANLQKITWTTASDPNGPVTYYYEVSHSNATGANGVLTSPLFAPIPTGSNPYINTPGTPEATYYWNVKACDSLGNCTDWTHPWKIIVDNTAPSEPAATPGAGTYTSAKLVSLSSNDGSGSGVAGIYYTTDGSTPNNTGNGTLYTGAFTVSSDETVKAIAYDNAGNSSTVMTSNYTIVATPTPHTPVFHTSFVQGGNGNNTNNNGNTSTTPQVLGASTNHSNTSDSNSNKGHVLGDTTTTPNTPMSNKNVATTNAAKKFFGLAWYWWTLIVMAILAFIYFVYRVAGTDDKKPNSNK